MLGLIGGLLISGFGSNFARGQQSADKKAPETRWQYCAITELSYFGQGGHTKATANICYFQSSGCRTQTVDGWADGETNYLPAKSAALAKAVNLLGQDGWELLGEGTQFSYGSEGADLKAIYFRRKIS
jgi:hypothetical protein